MERLSTSAERTEASADVAEPERTHWLWRTRSKSDMKKRAEAEAEAAAAEEAEEAEERRAAHEMRQQEKLELQLMDMMAPSARKLKEKELMAGVLGQREREEAAAAQKAELEALRAEQLNVQSSNLALLKDWAARSSLDDLQTWMLPEWDELVKRCTSLRRVRMHPGEYAFLEGDKPELFYMVLSGTLEVLHFCDADSAGSPTMATMTSASASTDAGGPGSASSSANSSDALVRYISTARGPVRAVVVNTLHEYEYFGHLAIVGSTTRTASVLCVEEAVLLVVDEKDFQAVFQGLFGGLSQRLYFARSLPASRTWGPRGTTRVSLWLEERRVPARTVIVSERDPVRFVCFIATGKCRVTHRAAPTDSHNTQARREASRGRVRQRRLHGPQAALYSTLEDVTLATLGARHSFGDLEAVGGVPHLASVIAETDVTLFQIPTDRFLQCLYKESDLRSPTRARANVRAAMHNSGNLRGRRRVNPTAAEEAPRRDIWSKLLSQQQPKQERQGQQEQHAERPRGDDYDGWVFAGEGPTELSELDAEAQLYSHHLARTLPSLAESARVFSSRPQVVHGLAKSLAKHNETKWNATSEHLQRLTCSNVDYEWAAERQRALRRLTETMNDQYVQVEKARRAHEKIEKAQRHAAIMEERRKLKLKALLASQQMVINPGLVSKQMASRLQGMMIRHATERGGMARDAEVGEEEPEEVGGGGPQRNILVLDAENDVNAEDSLSHDQRSRSLQQLPHEHASAMPSAWKNMEPLKSTLPHLRARQQKHFYRDMMAPSASTASADRAGRRHASSLPTLLGAHLRRVSRRPVRSRKRH